MSIQAFITTQSQRIDNILIHYLSNIEQTSSKLLKAMQYAVFNGGKRLRPTLVYATGIALDIPLEKLDNTAAAIELIHTYSLIHDDLPAMDDDDLRRGKPSCHRAFDEATAILAGDALQPLAFQILAELSEHLCNSQQKLNLVITLAKACGAQGMAGGQSLDLEATDKIISLTEIETIHSLKTGCLIEACCEMPCIIANATSQQKISLQQYSRALGLAYQIHDDLLDIESTTEKLGKKAGSDIINQKSTYPSILGVNESKLRLQQTFNDAISALSVFGDEANILRALAEFVVSRES